MAEEDHGFRPRPQPQARAQSHAPAPAPAEIHVQQHPHADANADVDIDIDAEVEHDRSDGAVEPGETGEAGEGRGKPKVPRARTACHQCRSAKSKCGGTPPAACPNCESMGRQCTWPEEDGRSTRARLMRQRSAAARRSSAAAAAAAAGGGAVGFAHAHAHAHASGSGSGNGSGSGIGSGGGYGQGLGHIVGGPPLGMDVPVGAGGAGDPGWLDGILGRGGRGADTRPSSSAPKNLAEFITRQQQKLPAGSGTGAGSAPGGVGVGVSNATPAPVLPRFINDFPSPWRSDHSLSPDQPHPPTQAQAQTHAHAQSHTLPPGQPLPQIPPQQVFPGQLPTLPHDPMVGPSRIPAGPSSGVGIGIGPTHPFILGSNSQSHYPLDPTGLSTFPIDNPPSQSFSLPTNAAGALPFDNVNRDLDHNTNTNPNPNPNPNLNLDSFSPFASMDPTELILALSSQLPTIEEGFPFDDRSPAGSSNQGSTAARRGGDGESPGTGNAAGGNGGNGGNGPAERHKGKIYKVTWWRPHGKTAIAPGLKRITLKVRVDNPQATWRPSLPESSIGGLGAPGTASGPTIPVEEVIAPDGMPTTPIMRHLLDVFMTHFGCQFPFVDRQDLESKIEERTGSVFLLNSIAAMAARFSTHPAIALPNLQPYEYGNVFYSRAKALLGSMFAVPQRETVFAFVLLANVGFANDSECEIWMMTGCAVRMSLDLALHLDPEPDSNISAEERRLNRLVFWSVLLMDHAISHGAGRRASFPLEDISQPLPTEEDIHPPGTSTAPDTPRSPFPFAAKQMLLYGPIINMLNRQSKGPSNSEADLQAARAAAMREYNQLPPDMQWNIANLQRHTRAHQGSIFVHLHLWIHNILATAYLTGTDLYRRHPAQSEVGGGGTRSGAVTPSSSAQASNLWRNSARTIGDILVLSDITNPFNYFSLPFVNQAFFVAGCCYIKEIEQHQSKTSPSPSRPTSRPTSRSGSPRIPDSSLAMTSTTTDELARDRENQRERDLKHADFSRALLQSVAAANISTLQQGLAKQTVYWSGVAWVSAALAQRIEGVKDVDLVQVTEKLASYVSLPDAGLIGKSTGAGAGPGNGTGAGIPGHMQGQRQPGQVVGMDQRPGQGRGPGQEQAVGFGQGQTPGQGYAQGMGMGHDHGQGQGPGPAPGHGPGLGQGMGMNDWQAALGGKIDTPGWSPSQMFRPTPPDAAGSTWSGDMPMTGEAFDWASFDLGNIEGENQSVIEQDVVLPQGFNWDWFK